MLINWRSPASTLRLQPADLHIWRADLQPAAQDQALVNRLQQLLSDDERARAERFYFEKDRLRFTLARGGLRMILSRYLNLSPAALQFAYGPVQKPTLAYPVEPLCFNLSHSQDLALYAVAWNHEVGIDIEQLRNDCDYEGIAGRFFSTQEQQELAQLSPDLQIQGFFNGWTRKEAILKAIGKGLTVPLEQLEVSLIGDACLRRIDWQPTELTRWRLYNLQVEAGYAAAVVVAEAGLDWQITGWQFNWRM